MNQKPKPFFPYNPFKFPTDDDGNDDGDELLLTEEDLARKGVVYCRKEILEQMRCTDWAKDEYLKSKLDPQKVKEWYYYHLNKCFDPFMDAKECVAEAEHAELMKVKNKLGPKGWEQFKNQWMEQTTKQIKPVEAERMWEMANNMPDILRRARKLHGQSTEEQQQQQQQQQQRQQQTNYHDQKAAATTPNKKSLGDVQLYPYTKEQSNRPPRSIHEFAGIDKPPIQDEDRNPNLVKIQLMFDKLNAEKERLKQQQQQEEELNKKQKSSWFSW